MMNLVQRMADMENGFVASEYADVLAQVQKMYDDCNCYIAGGCIVDELYKLQETDVDVFVQKNSTGEGIIRVTKETINNKDVDIVEIGMDIQRFIETFDLNIKKCFYDGKSFFFHDECKSDIENNTLTGTITSVDFLFRYLRACKKYNLKQSKEVYESENFVAYQAANGNIEETLRKKYLQDYLNYKEILKYIVYEEEKALATEEAIKQCSFTKYGQYK